MTPTQAQDLKRLMGLAEDYAYQQEAVAQTSDAIEPRDLAKNTLELEILKLLAERAMLLEAMHKLARLGNGEYFGNSEGNMIARAAISQCEQGEK